MVLEVAITLKLFPLSLNEAFRLWFNYLTPNLISTWEEMTKKFILKHFPPSRIVQFRNEITSFIQLDNEPFYDTWDRFNDLLRKCPYHEIHALCKFRFLQWSEESNQISCWCSSWRVDHDQNLWWSVWVYEEIRIQVPLDDVW